MATTFDDVDRRLRELEASLPRPSSARRPVARPLAQVLADLASLDDETRALRARRAGTAPPPTPVRDEPSPAVLAPLVVALAEPASFDAVAAWDEAPSSPPVEVVVTTPVVIEDELELDLVLASPVPLPATAEATPEPIELDTDLDADLDAVISVTSPSMAPMPESELPSRLSAVEVAAVSIAPQPLSSPPPSPEGLELDLFDFAPGASSPSEHSDIRPVVPPSSEGEDLDEEAIELDLFDLEDVRNSEERMVANAPRQSHTSTRAPPPLPPSVPPGERDSVPPERSLLGRLLRR